ncbi:MAG: hypothetical protein AB7G11_07050 [Phycisphaerales bacterium]
MLDRFTPAERSRLLWFVQRRHWRSMLAVGVFIGLGGASWSMMVVFLWLRRVPVHAGVGEWFSLHPVAAPVACLLLLALLACGALAGLCVRDHWLRWALSKHSIEAHCHDCAYSLADLPLDDGSRTCPECGQVEIVVRSRGLIPARIHRSGLITPD